MSANMRVSNGFSAIMAAEVASASARADRATVALHEADGTVRTISAVPVVNVYGKQARTLRHMQAAQFPLGIAPPATLRSERRDAKRTAWEYAQRRTGRVLTWKKARQLLARWARDAKAAHMERAQTR